MAVGYRVPGTGCQVPGAWDLGDLGTWDLGTWDLDLAGDGCWVSGTRYREPGTWSLGTSIWGTEHAAASIHGRQLRGRRARHRMPSDGGQDDEGAGDGVGRRPLAEEEENPQRIGDC